ncbi:MAG TPA: alpha/beta hydrolase, partial [Nitrospiraceae bacterium]
LQVPEQALPSPSHAVTRKDAWVKRLRKESTWGKDSRTKLDRGDILIFIHGYNNSQSIVMKRHRQLKADLARAGWRGTVVSFDWPSADMTLNYLEDRHDAKQTALQLVTDGITLLSAEQGPDCTINVHLLGHSTGAYVIREAFDDADDAQLANNSWIVSQVVLIGGDVSSGSLSATNSSSEALYRHCTRLTNYSNQYDSVLKLSNAKRVGMAPRVGRVGLPPDAPGKAVDIDCSEYFHSLESDQALREQDQKAEIGTFNHSWHIGNVTFAKDLCETLKGDLDRTVFPTRKLNGDGRLWLVQA